MRPSFERCCDSADRRYPSRAVEKNSAIANLRRRRLVGTERERDRLLIHCRRAGRGKEQPSLAGGMKSGLHVESQFLIPSHHSDWDNVSGCDEERGIQHIFWLSYLLPADL